MIYARWRRLLPSWIDVMPLELPGRGARLAEPLHTDLAGLADQLAAELTDTAWTPYALFGHSLGGLIAFEVGHGLRARGAPSPSMLVVSGTEAPAMRDGSRWREPLGDDALRGELTRLKGTPPEALDSPEIMSHALPILRADFLMCGNYVPRRRKPLCCPIQVFGGDTDETRPEALDAWRDETSASFGCDIFRGDHFFIHARQSELVNRIAALLAGQSSRQYSAVGAGP
ncbi:conserved hypothetical protein [Bradyrhizobium sp. ORS 375]|nr:conserved hypothetical protein [Bradyrhizobium sp. ORS 375]